MGLMRKKQFDMKEKASAIWSEYIIDGTRMTATPGDMLCSSCNNCKAIEGKRNFIPIIDETFDPAPLQTSFDNSEIDNYLKHILSFKGCREISAEYPEFMTKSRIVSALLDNIWKSGHFRLEDLYISPCWKWASGPIGNMAAFYRSVESACDYCNDLGIRINSYLFTEGQGRFIEINTGLFVENKSYPIAEKEQEIDLNPVQDITNISQIRKCKSKLSEDNSSWTIYIPFYTCDFRLGSSLLYETVGGSCEKAPDINDTKYFSDCYEVVRELIEDGIVKSGISVGDGGLMTALSHLIPKDTGLSADISGLMKSYAENNIVRILFSEVPGVIIEIDDSDYDYIDAEFLLQDVAYYPLGHPCSNKKGLRITMSDLSDISGILQALINGQDYEGED